MICLVIFASILTSANEVLKATCKPYIDACSAELTSENIPCSQLFDTNACSGRTKEEYWECISQGLNANRANMTVAMKTLEACFYEESKPLETYSFYKTDVVDGFNAVDQVPNSGEGYDDLRLTTFSFKDGDSIAVGDPYHIDINIATGSLSVVAGYLNGSPLPRNLQIPHINIHACPMSSTATTCSSKSFSSVQSFGVGLLDGNVGLWSDELALDTVGTWRIMGHIYFFTGEACSTMVGCQQTRWDVSMVKQVEVTDSTGSSTVQIFCVFSIILGLWQL